MALLESGNNLNLHPLIATRLELRKELGRISSALCQYGLDQTECIKQIIAVDDEIRNQGLDRSALEYPPIPDDDEPPYIRIVK